MRATEGGNVHARPGGRQDANPRLLTHRSAAAPLTARRSANCHDSRRQLRWQHR